MAVPSADAPRIFTGLGGTYERMGALLSLGQDPRWRGALVATVRAGSADLVLDVATGTGLVARALRKRYGCRVVGLDRSADMLAASVAALDGHTPLVLGRAESLPFPDASFDHLTFAYLLRYVDDPAGVMRELARVVRPGGRIAALDFGVPPGPLRPLWRAYTRVGLPVLGRLVSRRWAAVGAFLGESIERFDREHPQLEIERSWRRAGLVDIAVRRMSFGAGTVMSGTKAPASGVAPAAAPPVAPAFYALPGGGWRDYWTLLHPPYTAWHLSYVLLGAALAPAPDLRVVGGALLAFFLGVGVASHSFDELRGRPLRTQIPSAVLVALGLAGLLGATLLGLIAASVVGPWFLLLVALGAALVVLYAFEVPLVHSDLGFALAWGGFPVIATAAVTGAPGVATAAAAIGASLLSLAQRRLSTPVRRVRRKSIDVRGEIRYRDGSTEPLDAGRLIEAPEAALRLLWLAAVALALGAFLARWASGAG